MINLAAIAVDPDFAQPYSISRQTGQWGPGGWVPGTPTTLAMYGAVTVGSEKDLKQIPEGDRAEGAMIFYAIQEIYVTRLDSGSGTSDVITWRGEQYRVAKVWPYAHAGYWKAYAVRMKGN